VYTEKKRVHRLIKRNKTREEDKNYRRVGKQGGWKFDSVTDHVENYFRVSEIRYEKFLHILAWRTHAILYTNFQPF
jgi:hypothetical protein